MIEILEKNKKIKQFEDTIMASVMLSRSDFNFVRDRHDHKRYFTDNEHVFITSTTKLQSGDISNTLEAVRIAEAKLERNYYRYIRRCQKKEIRDALKTINRVSVDVVKTDKIISSINTHIIEICDRLKGIK